MPIPNHELASIMNLRWKDKETGIAHCYGLAWGPNGRIYCQSKEAFETYKALLNRDGIKEIVARLSDGSDSGLPDGFCDPDDPFCSKVF